MAQQPHTEPDPSAADPVPENVQAKLAEIIALLSLTAEQYQQQALLTKQTARAELDLSRRSLILVAWLLVTLGAGLVMLWGILLVFVGYFLLQATESLPLTAGVLFVGQLAIMYWCWRSVHSLLKHVGFNHTFAQIKDIFRFSGASSGGDNDHRATH